MLGREHLERLGKTLDHIESDLDERAKELGRRSKAVGGLVRLLAALIFALAIGNLYFVNDLTQEVRLVIAGMNKMTVYFAQVSERMDRMTVSVAEMGETVRLMPVMRDQMGEIADYVGAIGRDVERMKDVTHALDGRMDAVDSSAYDMSMRFRDLNQTMGIMGMDVDQMARPLP